MLIGIVIEIACLRRKIGHIECLHSIKVFQPNRNMINAHYLLFFSRLEEFSSHRLENTKFSVSVLFILYIAEGPKNALVGLLSLYLKTCL